MGGREDVMERERTVEKSVGRGDVMERAVEKRKREVIE